MLLQMQSCECGDDVYKVFREGEIMSGTNDKQEHSQKSSGKKKRILISFKEGMAALKEGMAARQLKLGQAAWGLYQTSGQLADLDRALEHFQTAVAQAPLEASPLDTHVRSASLTALGSGLSERYLCCGDLKDLDRAVRLHKEAVQLVSPDAPEHWSCLYNLGNTLRIRFTFGGNLSDLESAIQVSNEAVQRTPPDSPKRVMYLSNLVTLLRMRYTRNGDTTDLKRAIEELGEAVEQTPVSAPNRATYLNTWGASLKMGYDRSGDLADLEHVIQISNKAVQASPADSPNLPAHLTGLSTGLVERYIRRGDLTDLERAIQVSNEAVQQTLPGSPKRVIYLNNLGASLKMHYDRSGDLADLERAIQVLEEAVQAIPVSSFISPACRANLGAALHVRYTRRGDFADLERAIQMYNDALAQVLPSSPELSGYLNNLGNAWHARYDSSKDPLDLDGAIQVWDAAVKAGPPGSPPISYSLIDLGSALRERYTHSEDLADLERAIQVHEEAVRQNPPGSPSRPVCLNGLGNDLSARYAHGKNPVDLARATAVYEEACQSGVGIDTETVLMAARNWGNWALGRNAWDEAARAYTYGLDASDQLLRVQLLRSSKESWLRDARNLHAQAAYAFAQTGELHRAVEALERGHARLLSQTLEHDRAELGRLQTEAPDVYEQYAAAVHRLHMLETQDINSGAVLVPDQVLTEDIPPSLLPTDQLLSDAIRQAHADLDTAVTAVRHVPGYAQFLIPTTFEQIQQAVQDTSLVYLAVTPAGGLALVITPPMQSRVDQGESELHSTSPGAITPIWLNDLTWQALSDRLLSEDGTSLGGYLGAYMRWKADSEDRDAWLTALDEITRWLGGILMGPLTQTLTDLGTTSAILIPQGTLGLLPLHAAWIEDKTTPTGRRYISDVMTYSYVPNAVALSAVRAIASRTVPATLLALDEPTVIVDEQAEVKVEHLAHSVSEIEAARSYFSAVAILRGEDASRPRLLEVLSTDDVPSVWHFSCHGVAHLAEPLDSGLALANKGWLTVRDLLARRLSGVRLAVLSACETGVPGAKLPDEVVGLPTGLIQAGVAGIVASLWSANELSTTLLLVRFYDFWQGEELPPAEALCRAQRWVRDTTNREKADYFHAFLPEFAVGEEVPTGKASRAAADDLYGTLMGQNLEQYEFAHPYYWAAFGFTGV